MGFFRHGGQSDPAQAEALAAIESGGIPPAARQRLSVLATEGSLFTSGLSVNEFALLHRLGPKPLAQVMGASVVRIGWQYLPPLPPGMNVISGYYQPARLDALVTRPAEASPSQIRSYQWHSEVVCELDAITEAWNLARRRALDRLTEEALEVGADAVVGVHLRRGDHDLGRRAIEYVVTGTAVRMPDSPGRARPILTDVSVQDYWRLHSAGHEPVAFVATTAAVFASPSRATRVRRARTRARNQELTEVSDGFHAAREAVRARLAGQVSDAGGSGAVGVEFSHSVHREKLAVGSSLHTLDRRGWHRGRLGLPYRVTGRGEPERKGWVITMHAAGTAVRAQRRAAPDPVKTTMGLGG
jgi:uncharacterized protein YbjQ (UPF0145 family)